MKTISNHYDVSLIMAAFLVIDNYDRDPDPKAISASTLIKPLKKSIMAKRANPEDKQIDVSDLIASSLGSAIHDAVENVWTNPDKRTKALTLLGIPAKVQNLILVNPSPEELATVPDAIPVYLEQRTHRWFMGYKITGKFDQVAEGRVNDTKTTSVFSYMADNKDDDYIRQLSIYKWLNPDIITDDIGQINFLFTDWQGWKAKIDPNYPEKRLVSKTFKLLSSEEVEAYISKRISDLEEFSDLPEEMIPPCSDADLWKDKDVYKYYSDPAKVASGGRATKNFSDANEAAAFAASKGKGIVVPVKGKVRACGYCDAFEICEQKNQYELV